VPSVRDRGRVKNGFVVQCERCYLTRHEYFILPGTSTPVLPHREPPCGTPTLSVLKCRTLEPGVCDTHLRSSPTTVVSVQSFLALERVHPLRGVGYLYGNTQSRVPLTCHGSVEGPCLCPTLRGPTGLYQREFYQFPPSNQGFQGPTVKVYTDDRSPGRPIVHFSL
ncbi:Hypothetical predicted protein, partial [Marmota monax]